MTVGTFEIAALRKNNTGNQAGVVNKGVFQESADFHYWILTRHLISSAHGKFSLFPIIPLLYRSEISDNP